uniref:Reverse transcriptase domain-containing protein n=1 Tax=Tanacetum cinerariifolium TaxID=118510 RepID=A0A699IER2_TANCI|nr:hypothetical protein [Tanacetum cinerariifolium]
MKTIETFLEKFNCIPFEEKPQILFQAWEKNFAIQYSNPENPNELFQKLLEDLKELAEYEKSQSRDRPIFLNDDSDQNKECFENSSKEIDEVKNIIEQPAERGNRNIQPLQNFRVIRKSSISLNTSQISSIHAVAPILSTKKLEYSPSMGYEHSNTTPEMESDEIIKSGVEELVPILSENEVTSEYKKECDVLICEDSSTSDIYDNHSNIFFDSKIDDDISVYDDDFEDIEYVEASLSDQEIFNQEEENVVQQEEEESDNSLSYNFSPEFKTFCDHSKETRSGSTTTHADNSLPEYDSFCFEIEPDQERLINIVKNDIPDESRRHPFFEALLIDDSIPFPINESSNDLSIPRPPPELPDDDFDFNPDSGKVISVVINTIDEPNEDESFDPGGEIIVSTKDKDVDYFSFMFVMRIFLPYIIHPEVSPLFLSTES